MNSSAKNNSPTEFNSSVSMTDTAYDVIVIGVGGMGSAAVYHLSEMGMDTLGIERYDIPHSMGSSHGVTRIIRRGQYEHPSYSPLVDAAYDRWRALEDTTGRDLLHITGGIDAGPPDSDIFTGSRTACEQHDIEHSVLDAAMVNERFPGYEFPEHHRAVYQPESGFLVPEQCIIAHVEAAQENGAVIRARETVESVSDTGGDEVTVETNRGSYTAEQVIVTAGAWAQKIYPALQSHLTPVRQVLGWFQPETVSWFEPEAFPIFVHETATEHYYGFPIYDVPGFKLGKFNHRNRTVDPETMNRSPTQTDESVLRSYLETYFPDAAGPTMQLATCLFTNTPDSHFIIDSLPAHPRVTVGVGFSGHGFKFASVIGEILASLCMNQSHPYDIDLFRIDRLLE